MLPVLRVLCVLPLMLMVSGCSFSWFESDSETKGVQLADIRKAPPQDLLVKKVTIDRVEFEKSFIPTKTSSREIRSPLDKIRILRIFKRSSNPLPEYHLFSIWPQSPYAALGLKDGDILVAANDWVIYEPTKFKQYVNLLRNEDDATIEIRRGGRPMLYKYRFVGSKASDSGSS